MRLERITIAVTDSSAMQEFYSKVFHIKFEVQTVMQHPLYSGSLYGLPILLCPAELAGISAQENRHQLEFAVDDLDEIVTVAQMFGGSLMDEVVEEEGLRSAGIQDPDGNSIVFKQYVTG